MNVTASAAGAALLIALGLAPARAEESFEPYIEAIPDTKVSFEMVPVPAGAFQMGSPREEADRDEDEGPQVTVKMGAFWMGRFEVTWNEYDLFAFARRDQAPPAALPAG